MKIDRKTLINALIELKSTDKDKKEWSNYVLVYNGLTGKFLLQLDPGDIDLMADDDYIITNALNMLNEVKDAELGKIENVIMKADGNGLQNYILRLCEQSVCEEMFLKMHKLPIVS
ncbi:MAG: hypothetical protein GY874_13835 [Desulfobacteraceae bacterium]|nr:hypothetical protein [Desulfobacteraceae bacterium]